ncbi:MAG TPA: DNA repair protein RecN [Chloroflexota bacterium]|nr:DNA repair protein RecN [Chloroflexota bacterium]
MLTELTVSNFAIVDRLNLAWDSGFTVITGETGAGKSIIVDAIAALIGGRVFPDMVQSGASRASIEGIFELEPDSPALLEISTILTEQGIDHDDRTLIVMRDIASGGGRGVSRVNGRAVPLAIVQRVGEWLVDIHGQSEHLSLLRAREQLELLDRYARLIPVRQRMSKVVRELRRVRAERSALEEEVRRARREESLLRHEVAEIEAANLDPAEEAELQASRQRLRNAERLQSALNAAVALLGGDDERPGAVDLITQAASSVRDAARYDPGLSEQVDSISAASAQAEDGLLTVTTYLERLTDEVGDLESVEERVLLIADLKRKYGDSVTGILGYLEEARGRLERLERHDALIQELQDRETTLRGEASSVAAELTSQRHRAAQGLCQAISNELNDLGLRGTTIEVSFNRVPSADGLLVEVDGRPSEYEFDETGVERVELLIAPNPGEPARSLTRIASGGELARISLAIKSVLSQVDSRATLIFDEVDVGVGGRSAGVVGEKLWQLTRHHQVVCITHMPQVAAFADQHVRVEKSASEDSTAVGVVRLDEQERPHELAAMLAGAKAGSAALASARELIESAAEFKEHARHRRKIRQTAEIGESPGT